MFKVDSDIQKNRLYITLENLTTEDVQPILKQLNKSISELKQGFTCLVDIRSTSIDPLTKGSEYVEIVQGALNDSGMGKVARVINRENVVSYKQMEESGKSIGYMAHPVYSLEEGEKYLDEI
jgi:hypothetical protein